MEGRELSQESIAQIVQGVVAALKSSPQVEPERLLPLAKLAKLLPPIKGDKPPSRNTLYQWAKVGLKSRSGQRIKLETEFVGGILCSSLEAVRRLGVRKADQDDYEPPSPVSQREQAAAERRAKAALEEMRADGFYRPTRPAK